MILSILRSGAGPQTVFLEVCALLLSVIIAIVMHELAHGFVALKQGDYTAKIQGRLTFNPVKHFDPLGFLMMVLAGFGWAKPVPINPNYFKKYRKGLFLVSIAGVVTNVILAIIFALLFKFITPLIPTNTIFFEFFAYFFFYGIMLNVSLAEFNLLPIYPLDGFRIIESFTRYDNKFCVFMRKYGVYVFIALVGLSYIASYLSIPYLDVIGAFTGLIKKAIFSIIGLF